MTVLPDHEIAFLSNGKANEVNDSVIGGLLAGIGGERRPLFPEKPLIEPYNTKQLQPASYDIRLASTIRVPHLREYAPIDLRKPVENRTDEVDITDGFVLNQHHFVLASTVEWVNIPDKLVARIEGRSSLARIGLQIHSAGYIDPGFCGNITLEIVNFGENPILLWPDVMIGQLSFERLSSPCESPYKGKYQNSTGTVASRFNHA